MNDPAPLPRGTRPDAETADAIYLIKKVSALRPTYQIRLLALKAAESGKKLILSVPRSCQFHPALEALMAETRPLVKREELP